MSDINLVGNRWVFFRSLTGPMLTKGQSIISSLQSALTGIDNKGNSIDEHLANIDKYLKFIKNMASAAYDNELDFLKSSIKYLPDNDPIKKQLENFNSTNFDYIKFIALLNNLLQSSKEDKAIFSQTLARTKKVAQETQNIQEKSKSSFETMTKFYNSDNIKAYRGIFFSNISKNFAEEYGQSYSSLLAKKVNNCLRNLSKNSAFKDRLIQLCNNHSEVTEDQFKRIVVNSVVEEVLNSKLNEDPDIIPEKIINNLQENWLSATEKITQNFINAAEKESATLEQISLTTNKSVGEFVSNLDNKSIKTVKDKYQDPILNKALDELIEIKKELVKNNNKNNKDSFDSIKRKVSTLLNKDIREKANKINDKIKNKISKREFQALIKNQPDFITPTSFENGLIQGLKSIEFTHDSIAEAIVEKDVLEKIRNVLISDIPGKSITFKADIRFSTGYVEDDNMSECIGKTQIEALVNSTLEEYYKDFFSIYQDKSGGQTDIKLAMESYKEWVSEMQANIDKFIDLNYKIEERAEMKERAYRALEQTFSTSVSVKDYDLYNNVLGFHGGKLGSGKAPAKVMENITEMYALGGITALDAEALMIAVDNCGDAMLGGEKLRIPLENYLLGGAALIMFDDSFALSENFLSQMESKLKGQKVVNIYRLNTRYIPASFVLNTIYDNLTEIYFNLLENNPVKRTNDNYVTITNNNTENILEDSQIKQKSPEEQWKAVRDIVENNILIQFSFMGGLLDILQKLPSAFNDIK